MTKIQNIFTLSSLALVGALFVLPAISTDASARVTSQLMRCQFNTKHKVVDCCERVLLTQQKPLWMRETGGSCGSAAVCIPGKPAKVTFTHVSAKPKPRCLIKIHGYDDAIKGGDTPPPRNNPRTPNSRPSVN